MIRRPRKLTISGKQNRTEPDDCPAPKSFLGGMDIENGPKRPIRGGIRRLSPYSPTTTSVISFVMTMNVLPRWKRSSSPDSSTKIRREETSSRTQEQGI